MPTAARTLVGAASVLWLGAPAIPAADIEIEVPGCAQPALVSLPGNHDAAEKWPSVFHYHGMNGRPSTDWIRAHTGPQDWIVVGMPYLQQGNYAVTAESLRGEIVALHRVRDRLAASHGLDPERVHVSGLSKGGWMVDHLLQADRELAGGAILMAGHIQELPADPKPYRAGTQVFIGIGRRDANYLFALRALQFHRGLGAGVQIETWDELGHAVPDQGSPGLREWFALRAGRQPDEQALDGEYERISGLPPVDRWWALTHFRERPAVAAPDSGWGKKTEAALAGLAADPAVARESALFLRHRRLLAREIAARTVPEMEKVAAAYLELVGEADGTLQEPFIEIDLARVRGLMKKVDEQRAGQPAAPRQRPEVKPEFPDDRRRVPGNPLVR